MRHIAATLWVAIGLVCMQARADVWEANLRRAIARSRKEHKPILLNFSGSDWCGWCMKLEEDVFATHEFKSFAREKLVCVLVDTPHRSKLPEEIAKRNEKLKKKYQIKGFPTILLIDGKGNEIARTGYKPGGAPKYVRHLREIGKLDESKDSKPIRAASILHDEILAEQDVRVWQDFKGRKLTGILIDATPMTITIRSASGKRITVKHEKLSAEDLDYVHEILRRAKERPAHLPDTQESELADDGSADEQRDHSVAALGKNLPGGNTKYLLALGGVIVFVLVILFRKQIFREV